MPMINYKVGDIIEVTESARYTAGPVEVGERGVVMEVERDILGIKFDCLTTVPAYIQPTKVKLAGPFYVIKKRLR